MVKNTYKDNALLDDKDINLQISTQRGAIDNDVHRAIADFINNGNKHHVTNVLKAIEAFGDVEKGFAAWKDYALTGNGIALTDALLNVKVSSQKLFSLKKALAEFEQRQDEVIPGSFKAFAARTLLVAFHTAAKRLGKGEHRGGLTDEQQVIFDTFNVTRWMFDGPNTDIHPLTAALASHFKDAVKEKLVTSFAELKKHAGKPLIDEDLIRSEEIFKTVRADSHARFERLVQQSYDAEQKPPMQNYGFKSAQMPKDLQFGVEFEGFTALKSSFPKNIFEIAKMLKRAGLAASATLDPRESSAYDEWKTTLDGSIITPIDFIGRHRTHDLVVQDSPGIEVVSPILQGPAGHTKMISATRVLKDIKFRSNETCGFHMHIGIKDHGFEAQKNLVLALADRDNQRELDQLLSPERHGDNNKFATGIADIDASAVKAATTIKELVEAINPGMNRYSKYDMTGLVLEGAPPTIQFRGAGGAAYLQTVGDYTVILANFTDQAMKDPDIKLKNVIDKLVTNRNELTTPPPARNARQLTSA